MKKVLQFLGELNPLIFAILYFISTFMATFLIHFLPIFELSSSLENSELTSFSTSLYFSFITITTLGYGDIVPANEATRFLVMVLAFSGILLTGLFLNSLAYRVSVTTQEKDKQIFEEEQHKKEIKKYLSITPILFQDIQDFVNVTYRLITVSKDREPLGDIEKVMNLDFKLNDLQDLYKPSFLRKYNFQQTTIEVFYQVYDKLNEDLEDFLKLGYFSFDQDLMKKVINYLTFSKAVDSRGNILRILHDEKEKTYVCEMLRDAKETVQITEIANLIDPYIVLNEQIKKAVEIIKEIDQRASLKVD